MNKYLDLDTVENSHTHTGIITAYQHRYRLKATHTHTNLKNKQCVAHGKWLKKGKVFSAEDFLHYFPDVPTRRSNEPSGGTQRVHCVVNIWARHPGDTDTADFSLTGLECERGLNTCKPANFMYVY
ncbi:hypothetical protein E3U43_021379 [Larimichthys crocea]|uniref:Uncharacterized protein n=1 Tax=Larimichthys crocea TaxID=215358 RepID=A0ACD3R5S6_LARCR|nr:hypothetical protein E3U43_021379 [Larimichthys crocea]